MLLVVLAQPLIKTKMCESHGVGRMALCRCMCMSGRCVCLHICVRALALYTYAITSMYACCSSCFFLCALPPLLLCTASMFILIHVMLALVQCCHSILHVVVNAQPGLVAVPEQDLVCL